LEEVEQPNKYPKKNGKNLSNALQMSRFENSQLGKRKNPVLINELI